MKRTNIPYYPRTNVICTDGSTININFPYSKSEFYFNPDIKSNVVWLPTAVDVELEGLSGKSKKFANYEFDFESLVKDKS
jgi:hypothetical protein